MDIFDLEVPIVSLATELGPTNAFHISRRPVRRTPPVAPHRHEFFEVFWIASGCCTHFINRRTEALGPGNLVFIRPDDTHAFQNTASSQCDMVNVAFARETAHSLKQRHGEEIGKRYFWLETELPACFLLDQKGIDYLLQLEAALDRGPRSLARIEAFLLGLITNLLAVEAEIPTAAPGWLSHVCETMRSPEALRHGVPLLIRESGRSHEHVSRTFQKFFAQTPSGWVNKMRMAEAARTLMQTDKPIPEVALSCGIEDLSYFYRLFRQTHGLSPMRYRQRHHVDLVHPLQPIGFPLKSDPS